ncbi:toxin regulator [Romboutsia sp.]|uniref:toxin regulator n=1 Tax=Romboutsia sp. TaxID=1965302 RepID=UPI003F2A30EA
MDKIKNLNKKTVFAILGGIVVGIFMGVVISPACSDSSHNGIKAENKELSASVTSLNQDISSKDDEIETLNAKIDQAKPWFDMKEEEQKKIADENTRIEAEKKAQEEKARQEQERLAQEKEKQGYDTGISYDSLARNPKDNLGKKIKFNGEVVQVMEGDSEVQVRLAVGGNYDKIIYCVYDKSLVSSRILENDNITVYGISADVITYQSTMGGDITIPSMLVEKIDQ